MRKLFALTFAVAFLGCSHPSAGVYPAGVGIPVTDRDLYMEVIGR